MNGVHLAAAEVSVLQTANKAAECLFKNGQKRSGTVLSCFCVIWNISLYLPVKLLGS